MCWCKWFEFLLIAVIIIFALVQTAASKWLIFAAAVLILLHKIFCRGCNCKCSTEKSKSKKKR